MSTGHHAFMRKEGKEEIIKVALNEWGRYRASGHVFATEEEYNEQRANAPAVADDEPKASKKKKKKVMRRH